MDCCSCNFLVPCIFMVNVLLFEFDLSFCLERTGDTVKHVNLAHTLGLIFGKDFLALRVTLTAGAYNEGRFMTRHPTLLCFLCHKTPQLTVLYVWSFLAMRSLSRTQYTCRRGLGPDSTWQSFITPHLAASYGERRVSEFILSPIRILSVVPQLPRKAQEFLVLC